MSTYRGTSSKYKAACFFCDFWWLILLLIAVIIGGIFAYEYWLQPYVRPVQSRLPENVTLGTGDVQITLRWDNFNDLDLHVVDPYGNEIFYASPYSSSGGKLDVDANLDCVGNVTEHGIENIFWPTGSAPSGEYTIYVNKYAHCPPAQVLTKYKIQLTINGNVSVYEGEVRQVGQKELVTVFAK